VLPGHVMAFKHVVHVRHRPFELADKFGMADRHADEGGNVLAQATGVDGGMVAGDNAAIFELFDPFDHRGGGQTHLLAELGQRSLAMFLKHGQDLKVDRVQLRAGS